MAPVDPGLVAALLADGANSSGMALFLGAGCSLTSGVPLAGSICLTAQRDLFIARTGTSAESATSARVAEWARAENLFQDPARAYGESLQALRPTPRLRRQYLEQFFKGKRPGPGYEQLAALVRWGLIACVYSTNFDDLPEKALNAAEVEYRVVAFDEAAAAVEFPLTIPTLFKLHGDFLFDNMRNTEAEVATLPKMQARKLDLTLREGGLVVLGYGGCDESIMSILEAVDDVPLGVYWMHVGDAPPERAVKLAATRDWMMTSRIDGFDEFIALIAARAEPRPAPAAVSGFVAHERLEGVRRQVTELILGARSRAVVISGLSGAGKTTLAQVVVRDESVRAKFGDAVEFSGRNRPIGVAEILAGIWRGIGAGEAPPGLEDARAAVLSALSDRPRLLLLDNLDSLGDDVLTLISAIPGTCRVLITVRDAARLHALDVPFTEVRHPGLDIGEMRALCELHALRSDVLRTRLAGLPPETVDALLAGLHGWPQALLLLLVQLADPAAPIPHDLTEPGAGADVYGTLLKEVVDGLSAPVLRTIRAACSYPATFTVDGCRHAGGLTEARTAAAIRVLVGRHLIEETAAGSGAFSFAHPLIAEHCHRRHAPTARQQERSVEYLDGLVSRYGGQPAPDWANFRRLDAEFENIRALLDVAAEKRRIADLTRMMTRLFSYIVERGHWLYIESLCADVLATDLPANSAAEWWVWRSWIALYLRDDPEASARYAAEALATGARGRWARFQAHRRMIAALARVGTWDDLGAHEAAAAKLARTFGRGSDEHIDLLNTVGAARRERGERTDDLEALQEALVFLTEAENLNRARSKPNTREQTITRLEQARTRAALGETQAALSLARAVADDAHRMNWLRGIVDANRLVATLAAAGGDELLADSAKKIAEVTRARLAEAA